MIARCRNTSSTERVAGVINDAIGRHLAFDVQHTPYAMVSEGLLTMRLAPEMKLLSVSRAGECSRTRKSWCGSQTQRR